jgi:hypothetical protein
MLCLNASTVTFPKVGFYDKVSIRIKTGAQRREAILTGSLCMVMDDIFPVLKTLEIPELFQNLQFQVIFIYSFALW